MPAPSVVRQPISYNSQPFTGNLARISSHRLITSTAIAVALGSLMACSPITSNVPNPELGIVGEKGMRGIPYFLPQPVLQIQVFGAPTFRDEEVTTRTAAVPQSATAADEGSNNGNSPAIGSTGAVEGGNHLEPTANAPKETVTTIKRKVKVGTEYTLRIGKLTFVPEPTQQYLLRYHPSIMAEDEVNVKVGTDGLLTKVKMTTDDKTDEFVIKLIDVAKELSKSGLFGESPKAEEPVLVYEATFNPFKECHRINDELRRFGLSLALQEVGSAAKTYRQVFNGRQTDRFSGVAFHPVLPYTLICRNEGGVLLRQPLLLPDPAQICTFPIGRAAFVRKVTDLGFDHGVLTDVTVSKPSEALAFVEIPIALAKAVTEIPANIVQIRIDQTKRATSLATEQKNLLEAQKALLEAQAAAASAHGTQALPQQ